MYAGKIAEYGPTQAVLRNPLHPYTQALLKSVPRIDTEKGKLETIKGDVPKLIDFPSECRFNPRCPHAKNLCRSKDPYLIEAEAGHWASCFIYSEEWEKAS